MTKWVFRVGVVFCGRQSPGGHNIICGLYDAIKSHNRRSTLIGFRGEYLSRLVSHEDYVTLKVVCMITPLTNEFPF